MKDSNVLRRLVTSDEILSVHPHSKHLLSVMEEKTFCMPSGYPYIPESSFIRIIRHVPHLFTDGLSVLRWLERLEQLFSDPDRFVDARRAVRVVRSMIMTASVTAPSDLWLMRQILSEYKQLGILDYLLDDQVLDPNRFAEVRGLNARQLKIDLHFLYSRGYVEYEAPCFLAPVDPHIREGLSQVESLPDTYKTDLTAAWMQWFKHGESSVDDLIGGLLDFDGFDKRGRIAWVATTLEIESGYRLLPVVLALRALGLTASLRKGVTVEETIPYFNKGLSRLFHMTGLIEDGLVTGLGERVFKRGPGPFGIIGTYYPYLNKLGDILKSENGAMWVNRAGNVAASQDANRKTFKIANDALDQFCRDYSFDYKVFIEHAVGRGEATRQRFEAANGKTLQYVGADLEDAAIDEAIAQKKAGNLPQNMSFVRNADIGQPHILIQHLKKSGLNPEESVMMVGNGFHEVREQTNEKMLAALKGYREAGILLLFTEETGLTNQDLRATAWNTYHAGFRHVHEMSGQGLRPSWDTEFMRNLWSWRRCAVEAGYRVLDKYTHGTRPIYPIIKKGRENPSISITYFCVPEKLADALGVAPDAGE